MTEGARPLTWQGPRLEIAGREYTVRRLGLLDIQRVARIYAAGSAYVNRKALANMNQMSVEEIGTFVLDFIPYALDEVIEFVASLVGLKPGKSEEKLKADETNEGTIRDPNVFPISGMVDVIGALIEHEDVVAFFESVKRVAKSPALKNLTARLSERSMRSKAGTGGKTNTLPDKT
jgi:hypothetical protein